MPSSPEPHAHWAAILDEFEEQLARVDVLTAELSDAGVVLPMPEAAAPAAGRAGGPGPIPPEMRERATTVLAAQREAMSRLERLRSELSRHIGATRAASSRADIAVYLDRTA